MVSRSRSNTRLEEACELYVQRITNEGQAPTSIRTAHYALRRFRKAVASKRDPNPYLHDITEDQVDDYCFGPDGLRSGGATGKPIRAITFNRYRSVLKMFFEYALLKRWIDKSPMDVVAPARPDAKQSYLMLNATELLELLENAGNPVERIALSLGMNTGMRANDLRHLTVFDASLIGGTIQTEIRKTKKLDIKPITMELHDELTRWLAIYAEHMGLEGPGQLENDWLLIPSYRLAAPREKDQRIKLRPHQMHTHPWRLVQRPLARMGYPTKGTGFHTLRRSSARAFFEMLRDEGEGRDHALMIVQAFLNHADTKMTQLYLGLDEERVIRNTLLQDRAFLTAQARTEQARLLPTLPSSRALREVQHRREAS